MWGIKTFFVWMAYLQMPYFSNHHTYYQFNPDIDTFSGMYSSIAKHTSPNISCDHMSSFKQHCWMTASWKGNTFKHGLLFPQRGYVEYHRFDPFAIPVDFSFDTLPLHTSCCDHGMSVYMEQLQQSCHKHEPLRQLLMWIQNWIPTITNMWTTMMMIFFSGLQNIQWIKQHAHVHHFSCQDIQLNIIHYTNTIDFNPGLNRHLHDYPSSIATHDVPVIVSYDDSSPHWYNVSQPCQSNGLDHHTQSFHRNKVVVSSRFPRKVLRISSPNQFHERFRRIGEATNPGPQPGKQFNHLPILNIYHSNPTSLVGKEDHYDHMYNGIHLISETSATQTAQKICTARFKKKHMTCLWSHPTNAYNKVQLTSVVMQGAAVVSPFPMHRGLEPIPSYLQKADRFVDGVVQYYPHLYMYCAAVYGPHINHRYCNPRTIMNQIMNFVAQKGLRYQGPACISGDFNCPLTDIECWPALQAAGWVDAAALSASKNRHPLDATSNENARHSFILCNRQLAAALIERRTIKHHLFSVHPVLHAKFDLAVARQSYIQWKIPKSFDRFLVDHQAAEHFAQQQCQDKHYIHEIAMHNNDIAALTKSWTELAERTLAQAAVDVEGKPIKVRPGHLGRAQTKYFVSQPAAMPILPRPRQGDHQPISEQGSVELRRWGKQLHRLQSLARQYTSYSNTRNQIAHQQMQTLWYKILEAKGFENKFQQWILEHYSVYVPLCLPSLTYCVELKDAFAKWYTTQEHAIWLQRTNLKQLEIIVDIPKGGRLAFQQLRDESYPPLHAIHFQRQAKIIRTRCTKDGTKTFKVEPGHNLQIVFLP